MLGISSRYFDRICNFAIINRLLGISNRYFGRIRNSKWFELVWYYEQNVKVSSKSVRVENRIFFLYLDLDFKRFWLKNVMSLKNYNFKIVCL